MFIKERLGHAFRIWKTQVQIILLKTQGEQSRLEWGGSKFTQVLHSASSKLQAYRGASALNKILRKLRWNVGHMSSQRQKGTDQPTRCLMKKHAASWKMITYWSDEVCSYTADTASLLDHININTQILTFSSIRTYTNSIYMHTRAKPKHQKLLLIKILNFFLLHNW